jgi:hypothetical protein
VQTPLRRVKVADLSEIREKKGVYGTLLVGVKDTSTLVVDGEVSHQV